MSARDPTVTRKMEQDLREAGQSGLVEKIDAVADEVLKSPRALRPVEHAALLLRTTQTLNALEDLRSLANRMIDSGQDVSAVQTQIQASEALIDKYTHAADVSGTEAGRTLNIRKLLINRETLEIAALERKARADKGAELTAEDRVQVKETLDRLVAVKAELEAAEKANAEKDVEIARLRAEAALKGKKVRKPKSGKIESRNQEIRKLETKLLRELRKLGLQTNLTEEQEAAPEEPPTDPFPNTDKDAPFSLSDDVRIGAFPEDVVAFIKARGENPASVRGLVMDGKIYVNEAYTDQIEDILAHELVHVGIRGVFGSKVNTVLDRVAASTDPRLVEMADKARRTYQKQTRGMPEADANRLIAEEVVAQAAKADYQPSVIRDVFKRMRLLLKKLLGREYNLTDVQAMAALSQGYALRGKRQLASDATGRFDLADKFEEAPAIS